MSERCVGDLPALVHLEHDAAFRHSYIGEEDLVEVCRTGHIDKWAYFDAGRIHREQDIGDAMMLLGIRISSDETEHHVGLARRGGPDLLTIDDEVIAILDCARAQRRKIRSRARLRIPLAPDQLSLERPLNVRLFLFRCSEFKQCRHQHRNALTGERPWHPGTRELFGNDPGFQDIGLGAIPAVFGGNGTRRQAFPDQELLPGETFRMLQALVVRARRKMGVGFQRFCDLVTKRGVFGAQCQIHKPTLERLPQGLAI